MDSLAFQLWRILLVLIGIKAVATVHLICSEEHSCTIKNLRKTGDYFMYRYFPTYVRRIVYLNLLIEHPNEPFFDAIGRVVKEVYILRSKALKTISGLGSPNISYLEVTRSCLHRIEFEENDALSTLKVSFSNMYALSPTINLLRASKRIEITHAFLQAIDFGVFCDLSKLTLLSFVFNRIQHISNSATKACSFHNSLHYLYLAQNELKTINMELFNPFSSIVFLNLRYNALETLTGCFTNPKPFGMELTHNSLKYLDLCKWHLPKISSLSLDSNLFSTPPACMDHLPELLALTMENNLISNVSIAAFAMLGRLQTLNLSSNNMTSIELNTPYFPTSLKLIILSRNKLKNLDLSFVPVQSLMVHAQENLISSFDIVGTSPNVTSLLMNLNPIDCSWTMPEKRQHVACVNNSARYP